MKLRRHFSKVGLYTAFFHVDVKIKERFNYFNLKLFMSIFI